MRRLVVWVAAGLVPAVWCGSAVGWQADSDGQTAAALYAQGREALFRGEYSQAIELLTQAVAADAEQLSYRYLLARAYEYEGNSAKAEEILAAILAENPQHAESGLALGRILAERKAYEQVIETLKPILDVKHEYEVYHLLADAYYHTDRLEEARKNFLAAVSQNPQSPTDHYLLGNIYLMEGKFALAAESYETAARYGLDTPALHYKLATAYFNLKNYLGRIGTQTIAGGEAGTIKGEFYLIEPVAGLADAFHVAGSNSAIYHLQRALDGGIDIPEIHLLHANVWLSSRRYDKALTVYASLEDKLPEADRALYYYYYAQALLGTDDVAGYLGRLNQAVGIEPDTYKPGLSEAYRRAARHYNSAGDSERYVEFLRLAIAESPESADLHHELAGALDEAGQTVEAIREYRMVLELDPDRRDRMKILEFIKGHAAGGP